MNPEIYKLSQAEEDAGFRLYLVHDPVGVLGASEDGKALVAGYKVSSADMLIKQSFRDHIHYKLWRHGRLQGATFLNWYPIRDMSNFEDPGDAIQRTLCDEPELGIESQITPVDYQCEDYREDEDEYS